MMSAPSAFTWSMYIALTVPAVPTGMKAGVRIVPRGRGIRPCARAVGGGDGEVRPLIAACLHGHHPSPCRGGIRTSTPLTSRSGYSRQASP